MPNRWGLPDLGLGVGLRTQHFRHITTKWPEMDWFEIVSENFIDTEGRPLYFLDQVAERYPIVMHGVSLSVGSTDPIDFGFLDKLKALAKRVKAKWLGDHVCWTGVAGLNGHDLYPVPYTEEGLRHMVSRVRKPSRTTWDSRWCSRTRRRTSPSRHPRCPRKNSSRGLPSRRSAPCCSTSTTST